MTSEVLLDTCVRLDLSIAPERIGEEALARLIDPTTILLASAALAWEVAMKTRAGKLLGGDRLLAAWDRQLSDLGVVPICIEHQDSLRAGGLG